MIRQGHESADFFFGEEVEHTPALGRPTLFVIGYHTVEEIESKLDIPRTVDHIFFGANDSYRPKTTQDYVAGKRSLKHF